jgi:hypothetical protein
VEEFRAGRQNLFLGPTPDPVALLRRDIRRLALNFLVCERFGKDYIDDIAYKTQLFSNRPRTWSRGERGRAIVLVMVFFFKKKSQKARP